MAEPGDVLGTLGSEKLDGLGSAVGLWLNLVGSGSPREVREKCKCCRWVIVPASPLSRSYVVRWVHRSASAVTSRFFPFFRHLEAFFLFPV